MSSRRWFGSFLRWSQTDEGRYGAVHHGDRVHQLVKVSARWARELGDGTATGWHFRVHPHLDDEDWAEAQHVAYRLGPDLGSSITAARRAAEAWLLVPWNEQQYHEGSASWTLSMGGGGAVLTTADGRYRSAWPDHDRGCVLLTAGGARPPYTGEARGRWAGELWPTLTDDRLRVTWSYTTSPDADAPPIEDGLSWPDAVRRLSSLPDSVLGLTNEHEVTR
jgi:hypothetical protein